MQWLWWWQRRCACVLASVGPALVALLFAGSVATTVGAEQRLVPATAERTACTLEPGPSRSVTRVIDGETLGLDDGSEVRLIGALSPRPPDAGLDLSFWPPERDARAALERLAIGRSVTLGFSGQRTDRYGRLLAHVLIERTPEEMVSDPGGERIWVQAHLLAHGHARAYVLKDNTGCLRELSAHEAIARSAKIGLWSQAAYHMRDATRTLELTRLRSTYQIVEGVVTSTAVARGGVTLRFGRENAEARGGSGNLEPTTEGLAVVRDFSIFLKPAIVAAWAQRGVTLDALPGQRLRMRGWIERRGGPTIEIIDPLQIEAVEDGVAAAATRSAEVIAPVDPPPRRRSRRAQAANTNPVPATE